jgi:hypothetical protein
MGAVMDCSAADTYVEPAASPLRRLFNFAASVLAPRAYPELDLDAMPDHLKRDLGFTDGRDPRYEDEWPR